MEKWETGSCLIHGAMLGKLARERTELFAPGAYLLSKP